MFNSCELNTYVVADTVISLDNCRQTALRAYRIEAIQFMDKSELLSLQQLLGLGATWGTIVFPEFWMPTGKYKSEHKRIYNLAQRIGVQNGKPEEILFVETWATRFVCAQLMIPWRRTYNKASSTAARLGYWLVMAKELIGAPTVHPERLFDRLSDEAIQRAKSNINKRAVMAKLAYWSERGLWDDYPTALVDQTFERDWTKEKPSVPKPKPNAYQPFSDDYVAASSWRVLWMIEQLAPALIECASGAINILHQAKAERRSKQWCGDRIHEFLIEFEWRTPSGEFITQLPFELDIKRNAGVGNVMQMAWPPLYSSNVQALLELLQACHMHVFLLSTGGRISEGLSLKEGCIVEASDGMFLVNGRTYKLIWRNGGTERDWPLPAVGVQALKQQETVAALMRQWTAALQNELQYSPTNSLWTAIKSADATTDTIDNTYESHLKKIPRVFGLQALTGENPAHAHRFRKTIARLIALAIVGAPKIVMDLFGHKNIEMTLSYILTDPLLRSEMEEVVTAQTIMLAKEAFEHADENGGPAADTIRRAVEAEKVRLAKDKLGVEDIQELAETSTLNGKFWPMVRHHVFCTKGPTQSGPCAIHRASPEPSRCRSSCAHRLELYLLREDVDSVLKTSIHRLEESIAADEDLQAEYWIGQICANLKRFNDLHEKWSSHPTVKLALAKQPEEMQCR